MKADLVIYGKIYTSNAKHEYANAAAVKDGKYVYVGDEAGVKEFIEDGKTQVLDRRDKGIIMAGGTEGHGHYIMDGILGYMKFAILGSTIDEMVENTKKYVEAHPDYEVYYTFGWDNVAIASAKETAEVRTRFDEICSDKPMLICDNSGHNGFANSLALKEAGITSETKVHGGTIAKDDKGNLLGWLSETALNLCIKKSIATRTMVMPKDYEGVAKAMEDKLHSWGYTNYQDGWTNYFGTNAMDILEKIDNSRGLTVNVGGSYKIDVFDDWKEELADLEKYSKQYHSKHFRFDTVKLFADGEAVESGTGWLINGYADGSHGTQVWDTQVFNEIVKEGNSKGLSMHVHTQGDGASQQAVDAFVAAEPTAAKGIYNGIVHARNVLEETKDKMGAHNYYTATNINWRTLIKASDADKIPQALSEDYARNGFPVKSLLDRGVVLCSSTDVPAAAGAPTDVPGIIEIAVNDSRPDYEVYEMNPAERISIEQAMDVFTINGAKLLRIEKERGSVEVGKYADFICLCKDITAIPKTDIHTATVDTVYFEGKQVYAK